jgi:adenylosuccinate synthase
MVNGATKIALNFANYVDWSCYGKNNWDELGDKVHSFIAKVEDAAGVRVELVGTGPSVEHVAVRP